MNNSLDIRSFVRSFARSSYVDPRHQHLEGSLGPDAEEYALLPSLPSLPFLPSFPPSLLLLPLTKHPNLLLRRFKPSRWQALPPKYNAAFSTLSFIAGPHACIGKTMAIVEMKAVLGALITHFEFSPAYEGQVPQPTAAVTMKPKDNMPLRVRRVKRD
ncbi:hypothetical protein NLJ89_g5318 [Agrocybe chaxingu]|uniref:Cytochrome P450 n=1 Tax=Agrocybe chaxingu TaxID=84603 RepID=A0A9W8K2J9_9AGAR|nr:hypothetical protein NLJ89_g5318 [Agrocybe chaxingu]